LDGSLNKLHPDNSYTRTDLEGVRRGDKNENRGSKADPYHLYDNEDLSDMKHDEGDKTYT
jgi:hypothetical protein